jgi:hypothetical protein
MKNFLFVFLLFLSINALKAQFVSPWTNDYNTWYDRNMDIWRSGNICIFNYDQDYSNRGLLFSASAETDGSNFGVPNRGLVIGNRANLKLFRGVGGGWRDNPIVLKGSKGLALLSHNGSIMVHENGIVSIGLSNAVQHTATINQLSEKDYDGWSTNVSSGYKLYVHQGIVTEKMKVSLVANWPDYVFKKDYTLTPLSMVEQHIKEKGYLHKSKSAEQMEKDGIEVAETAKAQQEKIEELFLHLIDMDKRLKTLEAENAQLKADLDNNKK